MIRKAASWISLLHFIPVSCTIRADVIERKGDYEHPLYAVLQKTDLDGQGSMACKDLFGPRSLPTGYFAELSGEDRDKTAGKK